MMRDEFPITISDLDEVAQYFDEKLREEGVWNDVLPTNVGAFIKRIFAGSAVGHQHNIQVSARNAFYKTARRDSAIYAIARGQGTFIQRRTSAACAARMNNGAANTIFVPPYSQHKVDDVKFYNPKQYFVTPGSFATTDLIQGEVRTKTFDLDLITTDFYEFLLNEPGFTITSDIYAYTTDKNTGNTMEWRATTNGLFENGPDDRVFFHSTTGSGDVSLIFGNGEYGSALPRKATLTIRYIYSEGDLRNDMLPGVRTQYIDQPLVSGQTTESTTGGATQKGAAFYRQYGPVMFRSRNKKISAEEIKAAVLSYGGVADCAVLGQRDIAPEDKTYMNTLRLCVLPEKSDTWGGANPNPKSATWENFKKWLAPQLHTAYELQSWNATKVYVYVHVTIALFAWAADRESQIITQINENILALFRKRPGMLKRRVTKSDISKACQIEGVDYVEVLSPLEQSVILDDPTSYCVLQSAPQLDPVISERTDE